MFQGSSNRRMGWNWLLLGGALTWLAGTTVLAQENQTGNSSFGSQNKAQGQSWDFSGEVTGYLGQTFGDQNASLYGGRYLPKLVLDTELSGPYRFEAEMTPYLAYSAQNSTSGTSTSETKTRFHRAWVRVYDESLGARLGVQEIKFGPAKILRSLQWFDTLDYRDPTGFTEGVEGLLVRQYYGNNSNVWGWALVNSKNQQYGQAVFAPSKGQPQVGGRMEMQVGPGEAAVSFNHSQVNLWDNTSVPENRLGLEFHQDLGVGFWGEGALSQRSNTGLQPSLDFLGTLGLDYTFANLGGLYVLVEQQGHKIGTTGEGFARSRGAYSGGLPLSAQEQVRATYLESNNGDQSLQFDYRFATDTWVFGLVGSWNRTLEQTYPGVLLLAQWNH